MALVESITIPLGTKMPDFKLQDPSGKSFDGDQLYGNNGLLLAFLCNHCPYAIAVWPRFVRLANEIKDQGINAVAVNPNINPDYPEDAPDRMIQRIKDWKISFPYLVDADQKVARAFKAQCTPDIFLFDGQKRLIYHGRFDDNWQDEKKVKRQDLKNAVESYLGGKTVPADQKPSMGCSIKWVN